MDGILLVGLGALERGLLFSLLVLSVYLASRIMKYDDLSLEGSFSLGASLGALSLTWGFSPSVSLLLGLFGGAGVGCVTAFLHQQLRLSMLMSGIVVTSGLFSVVLMLAGANISLIGVETCFSWFACCGVWRQLLLLAGIVGTILATVFYVVHRSRLGLVLRATGANPLLVASAGRRIAVYKTLSLALSNALTGFVGALYVQYVGYFSIWMNVGILVVALSGLMLAELLSWRSWLLHLVAGSVVYQGLLAAVYECDVDPQWSKLLTALLIVAVAALKIIDVQHVGAQKESR